jgi:MFS family permease
LAGDSIAFSIGFAFYDPTVVIPAFVKTLTDSNLLVGLISAIRVIFITLPQIWAAGVLVASPRKKPLLAWSSFWGRLPVAVLAVATLAWARPAPWAVLLILTLGVAIFYTSEGLNSVSWPDIVAKVIPIRIRGRFLGIGQLLSSAGALVASYLVRDVLDGYGLEFPANWALMFALASVGLFVSVLLIFVIREQPRCKEPSRVDVREETCPPCSAISASMLACAGVGARVALGPGRLGVSCLWCAPRATARWRRVGGQFLGDAQPGRHAGRVICGIHRSRGQPRGHSRGWAAHTVLALLAVAVGPALHVSWIAYLLAFLLLGFVGATSWWSYSAYLMEIATEEERPVYLATSGIITSPTFIGAILAGSVFGLLNPELLFGLALA